MLVEMNYISFRSIGSEEGAVRRQLFCCTNCKTLLDDGVTMVTNCSYLQRIENRYFSANETKQETCLFKKIWLRKEWKNLIDEKSNFSLFIVFFSMSRIRVLYGVEIYFSYFVFSRRDHHLDLTDSITILERCSDHRGRTLHFFSAIWRFKLNHKS